MPSQRRGLGHLTKTLLGALLLTPEGTLASPSSTGKKVFAHYMVGDSTAQHRQQDIKDAKAIGLDGFSLNIAKPDRAFVRETMNDMFDFAAGQGFGLHISMDLWAAGTPPDRKSIPDYKSLFVDFFGHAAYERGANGFPMVTTFSSGGSNNMTWVDWRNQFAQQVFVLPNLDAIPGYWEFHPGFWEHWGQVVDGLFSWESAWPLREGKGGAFPGDIGPDKPLMAGMKKYNKKYMIGLSPLQYKDAYDTNIYRAGDLNLPTRMQNILANRDDIYYVNVLTWNDGPESHYVGSIWPEQNTDPEPAHYMKLPHKGWQRVLGSFIAAFKGDGVMRPFGSDTVTGAFWYKSILSDTKCSATPKDVGIEQQYLNKPESYETATDKGAYAVVLPQGASGWSMRVHSGGKTDTITGLKGGLNSGNTQLNAGAQSVEILNLAGQVVAVAGGGRCVYGGDACPDCTYNINPNVVEFTSGSNLPASSKCDEKCTAKAGSDWGDVSKDGKCGPDHGNANCIGSTFGSCCSLNGECGMSTAHCGTGCHKSAGMCYGGKKEVDDPDEDQDEIDRNWPDSLTNEICSLKFDTDDPKTLTSRWIQSGAATWFLNFLNERGAGNWTDKFFMKVMGQNTLNFDCLEILTSSCDGPKGRNCTDYIPPPSYYVHLQMGNLHAAIDQLWGQMVTKGIENLSKRIDNLVKEYGTPPESKNSLILNMFVGVLTSLAGMSGHISDISPGSTLGKFANPLTIFSGIFAQASAADGAVKRVSPEDLKDSLENVYGTMFIAVMGQLNETLKTVFGGRLPEGWSEDDIRPEDYVWMHFAKGEWLNYHLKDQAVNLYAENTQQRFIEFATVTAMKTGGKSRYRLLASPSKCISEEECKKTDGAYFYKDYCLAFGYIVGGGLAPTIPYPLKGKDLTTLRSFLPDLNGALVNNFDCYPYQTMNRDKCPPFYAMPLPKECNDIPEPTIPSGKDLDFTNPMIYPKCYVNFPSVPWEKCIGKE
ncbi:uncharacterized protein NECHADRAFT_79819 [Fusarium vanettenii 77-13-4]|uniref:Chitin-binding type-1 domain-containing protein n=1 Tax=Fusarium vanettenii (strain ATCC MYA-4622 / CBS 123669 / FGSC 9596 / NRRL 45880 / 77-13-4) TaxID=660122 RepID=C7ZM70_FUSV7|nr:uncharacterized protein NECHADRAFT_79819 [Fusarium vanettenii 77-13-4]EEU34917.1 predicted protein [Fusarium vanettenii 77-13-4]